MDLRYINEHFGRCCHYWRNKEYFSSCLIRCTFHVWHLHFGMSLYFVFSFRIDSSAFALIFEQAFSPDAAFGGFLGVLIIGIKRAVFSNEAGIGSAAIAHSAAKVSNPVEEGSVALLEPFIDTIVVCTMTALVIIITGSYLDPANADFISNNHQEGALTSAAMGSVIPWFPYILSVAVFLFAFSTMISWSYYGERCLGLPLRG